MLFHPTDLRLGLFADGELPPRAVRRVARHLQGCGRCRARVTATRRLSRDARELEIPPLPPGLRSRVLHGLAVGEPVIVPIADPPVQAWPWRRLLWAGAGVLVILGGVRLAFSNALQSEASRLELTPSEPAAGEAITVTYHASGQLGSEPALRLRAEYRRSGDQQGREGIPQVGTALLERRSNRTYRAQLLLPADVAYATFAVEDEAGQVVDYRGGLKWELLVYADGRPSYDALFQRAQAAVGSDLGEALESAVEATRLYPNRVEAWSRRSTLELEAYGLDAFDSLRPVHTRRLHALDDQLGQTPVSADVIGAMYRYANAWNVEDVAARWRQRALRDAPWSAISVQLRTFDILRQHEKNPRVGLRLLDGLYQDAGAAPPMLATQAFGVAYQVKDPDACLRWAERVIAIEPRQRSNMARQLLSFPSLRDTVLAWIDGEIHRLSTLDDRYRPLFSSLPRYRASVDSARSDLLGLKGQVLLAMGETLEARAYLDSAVAQGWDLARFHATAVARLAAADTLGAARLLARIAVDPAASDPEADQTGRRLLGASAWTAERERALSDMMSETRREAEPRRLYDPVRVTGRLGDTADLREALQGRVTVVAFWHPLCLTCLTELEKVRNLVAGLPGAPRLAIVSRRPLEAADWTRLDDAGIASLVTVDGKDEAMRAFGVWGTAGVFVVDPRGVIQYRDRSLGDLPRCIMTLIPMQDVVAGQGRTDTRAATADRP
jgi:hypothetical protein